MTHDVIWYRTTHPDTDKVIYECWIAEDYAFDMSVNKNGAVDVRFGQKIGGKVMPLADLIDLLRSGEAALFRKDPNM